MHHCSRSTSFQVSQLQFFPPHPIPPFPTSSPPPLPLYLPWYAAGMNLVASYQASIPTSIPAMCCSAIACVPFMDRTDCCPANNSTDCCPDCYWAPVIGLWTVFLSCVRLTCDEYTVDLSLSRHKHSHLLGEKKKIKKCRQEQ